MIRLPSTLRGALVREVETLETRSAWYFKHAQDTAWWRRAKQRFDVSLAAARRAVKMFDAGLPPRLMPGAGQHDTKKGPGGLPLCRWCETELTSKRRTFCGPECVHEWKLRSDAGYARKLVFERDAGQCALCPTVVGRHGPWEMDHLVPVVEGGGCCGLENLRTLCGPCHRGVTAALARRMADARRGPVLLGIAGGAR